MTLKKFAKMNWINISVTTWFRGPIQIYGKHLKFYVKEEKQLMHPVNVLQYLVEANGEPNIYLSKPQLF